MIPAKKMTTRPDTLPWKGIPTPAKALKLLRVSPEHPHNFFWGRDANGCYLLVLKYEDVDFCDKQNHKKIEFSGIKTEFRLTSDTGETFLMFLLQETEQADIFLTLCNDLIQRTESDEEISAVTDILFSRLECWRLFLSRSKKKLLSDRQIQGLFSELKFMMNCLEWKIASPEAIVEGWHGPSGKPHDFVLSRSAVEVKSIIASQSNLIPISSENQLQTHLDRLYLSVFLLSRDVDCATGMSLNDMVRELRERLAGNNLQDAFEERLMGSGYIDIQEYDSPCFSVSNIKTYHVEEGFPSITPDMLPQGITDVSYRINFNSIVDYICDISTIGE
jgi:hypothetical protein